MIDSRPARLFATIAVIVLVLLSGCSAPIGAETMTPTPESMDLTPRGFPAFPELFTDDSVGQYVADFEEVYRHNAILAANTQATAISVNCEPQSVDSSDDTSVVTVSCAFSWEFEEDGSVGIADGVPYEATYRVSSGGLTERVGSTL